MECTRRACLSTIALIITSALTGCGAAETVDQSGPKASQPAQSHLVILSGEMYTLESESEESYHSVEIQPTGEFRFEQQSQLNLQSIANE
jgi:hypothetical protein